MFMLMFDIFYDDWFLEMNWEKMAEEPKEFMKSTEDRFVQFLAEWCYKDFT